MLTGAVVAWRCKKESHFARKCRADSEMVAVFKALIVGPARESGQADRALKLTALVAFNLEIDQLREPVWESPAY